MLLKQILQAAPARHQQHKHVWIRWEKYEPGSLYPKQILVLFFSLSFFGLIEPSYIWNSLRPSPSQILKGVFCQFHFAAGGSRAKHISLSHQFRGGGGGGGWIKKKGGEGGGGWWGWQVRSFPSTPAGEGRQRAAAVGEKKRERKRERRSIVSGLAGNKNLPETLHTHAHTHTTKNTHTQTQIYELCPPQNSAEVDNVVK